MTRGILAAVILAISLLAAQTLFASSSTQTAQSCNCCVDGMRQILNTLNLSTDQQAKIKAIKAQLKSDTQSTWDQLNDIRRQIHALMQSDKVDEAKLDSLVDKKWSLLVRELRLKSELEFRYIVSLLPNKKLNFNLY
ncbi:Spy/CpxP family protein refolding chaperone [Legionella tunisiensis]|uniref:Spy/CpxP family protein refolding chaperone n=1 Tax=Legionella tunisiensis TaxID=1034944 RepID=UPI0004751891|nr:periplasmic heavy metal sensor [Legionella tunisiensis]